MGITAEQHRKMALDYLAAASVNLEALDGHRVGALANMVASLYDLTRELLPAETEQGER